MPRPIRFRFRYAAPADRVYGTLVDRSFLDARLAHMGGKDASVVEITSDADGARYVLHQGVGAEQLPGSVRTILPGDLVIERTETWRQTTAGRYQGTVTATVRGAPGQINGELSLVDLDEGGSSEFGLDGAAKVDVPLLGGAIEAMVAEQITKLIDGEARFTEDWLAR
ncbi:MAG: DUF2505 domain-containing protein [Pseudonocardia sp.]|nr:DUF2505 domain-containing protein [Pseudonocardia sp.]